MATASACTQSTALIRRPNRARQSPGRFCPVASPVLELRYWMRIAMTSAMTITQTSW